MTRRGATTSETIEHFLAEASEDAMFRYIRGLVDLDRYQASEGILQAAEAVAGWSEEAGLSDVTIEQYPADGKPRWWTFDAPSSWTPTRATLSLDRPAGRQQALADQNRDPFSLATYSAATPSGGAAYRLARWGEEGDLNGRVVVLGRDSGPSVGEAISFVMNAGAAGFVTDKPAKPDSDGRPQAGRIELSPRSPLFAFSVTPRIVEELERAERRGDRAWIDIAISDGAAMPVVSATLAGEVPDEIWIISHLCHPRPGANDNASGAAATLGLARALAEARGSGRPLRRTVRFLFGPEFVGTVASLHDRPRPSAVVNLDMVGEDQSLCASPFVLERAPEHVGSLINPLAENAVFEAFRQTGRHGGAWQSSPFVGFSDHALFADATIATPAVQFCHPTDRFNHSAADTLDKVSPVELRRTVAAAAALLFDLDTPLTPSLRAVVERWCDGARGQAERVARSCSVEESSWATAVRRDTEIYCAGLLDATDPLAAQVSPREESPDPAAPQRQWDGPFNARAMLNALGEAARKDIRGRIEADKGFYSTLVNFGLRIDGRHSRSRIAEQVGIARGRQLEPATTERVWSAFDEAGFIR